MARRRRAKNNLLPKMIGVAVLINAVLLPLLATLGVFKAKKGQTLMQVKLVKLPPVKKVAQKKPPEKKKVAKAKARPSVGHRQQTRLAQSHPPPPNPNQPKVVATSSSPNGNGPSIVNNGTGQAGVLNTGPASSTTQKTASTTPVNTPPATQPTQPAPPTPVVTPPPAQPPVYVEAEPVSQPQPDVPDDLADQEIHATYWAVFDVRPDGSFQVTMDKSTGIQELDDAIKETVEKWTFKPGTKDGVPIESFRRLRVDVNVG